MNCVSDVGFSRFNVSACLPNVLQGEIQFPLLFRDVRTKAICFESNRSAFMRFVDVPSWEFGWAFRFPQCVSCLTESIKPLLSIGGCPNYQVFGDRGHVSGAIAQSMIDSHSAAPLVWAAPSRQPDDYVYDVPRLLPTEDVLHLCSHNGYTSSVVGTWQGALRERARQELRV